MKCANDLKRNILTFDNPEGFVRFSSRREIYEGFMTSSTALRRVRDGNSSSICS